MKQNTILLSILMSASLYAQPNIHELIEKTTATPHNFEAHFDLGVEYFKLQHYEKAIVSLNRAIELEPTFAQTYLNLGLVYISQEQYEKAREQFTKAIQYRPDYIKAYYFRGLTEQNLKNDAGAIDNFSKTLQLNPHHFEAAYNLGRLYRNNGKPQESISAYERAANIDPKNINALFELAYMHTTNNNFDQAIEWYNKVLALQPQLTDALCNMAHTLKYKGEHAKAAEFYRQTLKKVPEYSHAHYGLGECLLATGQFEEGWQEFEWRWKRAADTRNFGNRYWDGSNPANKTILLRAEYGQGDTLQFIRYAKLLKDLGAHVIVESQVTLTKLLSQLPYIDQVVVVNENTAQLPAHDFQIPIMSLPRIFKTTINTVPHKPYLAADPELVTLWKEKLSSDTNFKIGICWDSSPYYEQFKTAYSRKNVPLNTLLPLLQMHGVSVYSLQKINGMEQIKELPIDTNLKDLGADFDFSHGRFMDTAAVIENLDLVVTVDTSVAHLAGGLGKPVFVMLPYVADWRWMTNRNDSPWYPSMQLFRQAKPGDWHTVVEAVCSTVASLTAQKRTPTAPIAQKNQPVSVLTEVQIGELIDKITILEIKMERIKDPAKLKNVKAELDTLMNTCRLCVPQTTQLTTLWQELKKINEALWVIEDDIRDKERAREFDARFIELARSVYYTNDERCRIKRDINILAGSRLMEEKSYSDYKTPKAA